MRKQILKKLAEIEMEHDVRIIYACESGSRAWGVPSKDSDYDVRFIYAHPRDYYLSISPLRDVIELPIDPVFDINGWDIRKALSLLRKSNIRLLEWLQSPIVYVQSDEPFELFKAVVPFGFSPERSARCRQKRKR